MPRFKRMTCQGRRQITGAPAARLFAKCARQELRKAAARSGGRALMLAYPCGRPRGPCYPLPTRTHAIPDLLEGSRNGWRPWVAKTLSWWLRSKWWELTTILMGCGSFVEQGQQQPHEAAPQAQLHKHRTAILPQGTTRQLEGSEHLSTPHQLWSCCPMQ